MRRLGLLLALAGCAAAPVPEPGELEFARRSLARVESAPPRGAVAAPERIEPVAAHDRADEIRGLVEIGPEVRAAAASEEALTRFLAQPRSASELAALVYLRAPAVAAARARYEAARTGFAQADDLQQLVGLYGSWLTDTRTRVGPEKSRRPTATVAPSPNLLALSGEVAARTVEAAFEELRLTVRDLAAEAVEAHADAAHLAWAQRIVGEDVALHEDLVAALSARFEAGRADQAGLLAFQARLESLRTERAVLEAQTAEVRARWNRLLHRPDDAPIALGVTTVAPAPPPDADGLRALARTENQELRAAALAAERASIAVRLAETMTLPRMDVGSSRLEREMARDVFPEPGRMSMPRYDFGVREAQVAEMRARAEAMQRAREAAGDRVDAELRAALFALERAARRWTLHDEQVVPLAGRAFEAARGAYEGNRTGYVELLDRARALLQARLARADALRDHAHARARLLRVLGVLSLQGS